MEAMINSVLVQMQPLLTCGQLRKLGEVMRCVMSPKQHDETDLLPLFLTAKEVEGCSPRTIEYYANTIRHMVNSVAKPYTQIESDDLRRYLSSYEAARKASKIVSRIVV